MRNLLQADAGAPAWKAYVKYAAGIVINGLSQCVIASTDQLLTQARSRCALYCSCSWHEAVSKVQNALQLCLGL